MVETISLGTPTGRARIALVAIAVFPDPLAAIAGGGQGVQVHAGFGRDFLAGDVGLRERPVQRPDVNEDCLDARQREPVAQVLVLRAFGVQSADEDNGLLAHWTLTTSTARPPGHRCQTVTDNRTNSSVPFTTEARS